VFVGVCSVSVLIVCVICGLMWFVVFVGNVSGWFGVLVLFVVVVSVL
jgi:hypothetical protein